MLHLECSEDLRSLRLPNPSLLSSLLRSHPKLLPVPLLARSDLIAEIHRGEPIDKAGLILETLLGHIEGLLHCHCERHAQGEHEAAQQQDDINKVDMMRSAPRRAHEGELLEVDEAVVDEGEEDGTEDHEAQVYH